MNLPMQDEAKLRAYFAIARERGGVSTFGFALERAQNLKADGQIREWHWLPDGGDQTILCNEDRSVKEPFYEPDERKMMCAGEVSRRLMKACEYFPMAHAVLSAYHGDHGEAMSRNRKWGRIASVFPLTHEAQVRTHSQNSKRSREYWRNVAETVEAMMQRHAVDGSHKEALTAMHKEAMQLYGYAVDAYVRTDR